ncbi:MAG: DUF1460 domain-containing protein [Gammaproteobacteria bacterium]|jgi:hypothetical protein|nr:DUF1460 domain-containing protein [Gammaproteobacteria bacterium]
MVEGKANPKHEVINGYNCLLELGGWTPDSIDSLLSNVNKLYADPSSRMQEIVKQFVGTKFGFESMSPVPPKGVLRVRLEFMDCVTYIYNMLALCKAKNFNDFISNLYKIRYLSTDDKIIDSDPDTGNVLDFAEESLIINCVNIGFLKDITEEVAGNEKLMEISVDLKRFQRYSYLDSKNMFVSPRFGERVFTEKFISVDSFDLMNKNKIKSGDIILLSEGPITKHNMISPVSISHLAIAHVKDDELYFYHSTRHFYWRPHATTETPPSYTGIFLDKDRKKEIIGTALAGIFAGEETKTEYDGLIYFGLNQEIKRPLKDFASRLFKGFKVMRII